MTNPRRILSAMLVAATVFMPAALRAQGTTTGAIAGTVTNEQGQPVPAAQVQAVSRSTGFSSTATTRTDGRYLIPGLEVGGYTITVRRLGFEPQSRPATVTLSQATQLNFTLSARAMVLSAVTVQADASASEVINPSRTGVQVSISDTALRRLPTLNRNFTDFVALTPQVSTSSFGLSGGGTNNRYNNIQIDGSIESDIFGLGSTGQPGGQARGKSIGLDAVKEYQVLLSPYDVRHGNFAGILVNAVTKSGTNEFHGSLFGTTRDEQLARKQPYITDYKHTQFGGSIGGPIVKDKALFFLNAEMQRRTEPASGPYVGLQGVTLSQAAVEEVTQAAAAYGIPGGSASLVNNDNPLTNIFARLDFNLPWNTQLVVHHNYGHAEDDKFGRSTNAFQLSSNGYKFKSDKNGTVAQFRTLLSGGVYNELFLNNTSIRDRRSPNVRAPQVQVNNVGGYNLVLGSERFSQGNELDQDIQEVTDNLTIPMGSHRLTVGTQNQFIKFRNLFTQASYGVWNFGNLDSLKSGIPNSYVIGVPLSGDGAVRFRAAQYSAYLQDDWAATPTLNFTAGVRMDVPVFGDKPPANDQVLQYYGRNTQDVPSGNMQWSPRVGFNWDVTGDQRNQLRGGIGMFTGRPAYVWLSNAFQNSGSVGVAVLTCSRTVAPHFTTDAAANPPSACTNGTTARAGGEIDLLDKNLKFPQNLRTTLAYDRRLFNNWVLSLEGMASKEYNGIIYQNIALTSIKTNQPAGISPEGRWLYGTISGKPDTLPGGRNQIFDAQNQSKNNSYQLTTGLTRKYANQFEGSLYYTYTRAKDVVSLTSSTAFSQYRYGRVWGGNQNDLTATTSSFEQRHKVTGWGSYSFPTNTDISLIYVGTSGSPYTYVSSSDLNDDGVSSNDPIYIPKNANDPNEMVFVSSTITQADGSKRTFTPAEQAQAFENYIAGMSCLNSQRGHMMDRNSCFEPWTNRLDLAARQRLGTLRGQQVALEVQVFNFLNLINGDWGKAQSAGGNPVTLLSGRGFVGGNSANLTTARPTYSFDPSWQKYLANNLSSNYQIQVQLKYSF